MTELARGSEITTTVHLAWSLFQSQGSQARVPAHKASAHVLTYHCTAQGLGLDSVAAKVSAWEPQALGSSAASVVHYL